MNTQKLTLKRVVDDIHRLPSFPKATLELLEYLKQDEIDASRVAAMISQDAAMMAKLLRIANSPFYGMSREIATAHQAIVILGLRPVRSLITAAAITAQCQAFVMAETEKNYFWLHSFTTALCARRLSQTLSCQNPDSAFIAGLLHDIGRLILLACFRLEYEQAILYQNQNECIWITAEQNTLEVDHTQAGAELSRIWNFPQEISDAIAWHHTPEEQADRSLANLIFVADHMAYLVAPPLETIDPETERVATALKRLGCAQDEFQQAIIEVTEQVNGSDIAALC